MKKTMPWAELPLPVYPAKATLQPRKRWVVIGGWMLSAWLLLFGITAWSRNPMLAAISVCFAALYLLTLVTQKDAALTDRGLEIFYDMRITTRYEFFPWEEINAIVCEDRGHADMVRLHIGYGNMEKALFFPRRNLSEIYDFCRKKHPGLRIVDYAAPAPKGTKSRGGARGARKHRR